MIIDGRNKTLMLRDYDMGILARECGSNFNEQEARSLIKHLNDIPSDGIFVYESNKVVIGFVAEGDRLMVNTLPNILFRYQGKPLKLYFRCDGFIRGRPTLRKIISALGVRIKET